MHAVREGRGSCGNIWKTDTLHTVPVPLDGKNASRQRIFLSTVAALLHGATCTTACVRMKTCIFANTPHFKRAVALRAHMGMAHNRKNKKSKQRACAHTRTHAHAKTYVCLFCDSHTHVSVRAHAFENMCKHALTYACTHVCSCAHVYAHMEHGQSSESEAGFSIIVGHCGRCGLQRFASVCAHVPTCVCIPACVCTYMCDVMCVRG